MAEVLVDTSAVFALLARDDQAHAKARAALKRLKNERAQPVLTNFIVAEIHALLLVRMGADIARRWLRSNVWPVERVTDEDEVRARAIIEQFCDKTYSYTDATSFAVMERRRLRRAMAFDRHFSQFGFDLV